MWLARPPPYAAPDEADLVAAQDSERVVELVRARSGGAFVRRPGPRAGTPGRFGRRNALRTMDLQLSGKRALVTGSTSGIGEAIARELAAEGVAVVVQGRDEQKAHRVAQGIGQNGGRAAIAIGDLAWDDGAKEVAERAVAAFGGIDILVNNAGAFPVHDWWQTPPGLWSDLFQQNVISMVRMIQALVPPMRQRGWGRVIQLSSVVGLKPLHWPAYAATKAAILNMTVSLAKELADTGVTVNSVSPGPILTPGLDVILRGSAEDEPAVTAEVLQKRSLESLRHTDAIGRFGRPDEVAAAAVFLASPRASYIHGSDVHVDGGDGGTVT